MGRKRAAEEYNRTAQENGWAPGAHAEEDDRQQTKNELSERLKRTSRRLWISGWYKCSTLKDGLTQGLQLRLPPENANWVDAVLEAFLLQSAYGTTARPLAMSSSKTSSDGIAQSRSGRLDETPNIKSVRNTAKKFFSGFQRVTGTEIGGALRNDI
jgi:hypothetical protein